MAGPSPPSDAPFNTRFHRYLWLDALFTDPLLSPRDQQVGYLILKHINEATGTAWPSKRRLALMANTDPRTVQRAIARLEEVGYITARQAAKHVTNTYRISDAGAERWMAKAPEGWFGQSAKDREAPLPRASADPQRTPPKSPEPRRTTPRPRRTKPGSPDSGEKTQRAQVAAAVTQALARQREEDGRARAALLAKVPQEG